MKNLLPLVHILSNGALHSGEDIATSLNVSRAAVWKKIQQLEQMGLEVNGIKGVGYQLVSPLELLSSKEVLSCVENTEHLRLEICSNINSTNSYLIDKTFSDDIHGLALLAEHQEAGKGRRGRHWLGVPFTNIYLSIGWHYDMGTTALEGLSLAVGVELVERLQKLLPQSERSKLQLKWPNDVLYDGKKLAGILIEVVGDIAGGCMVVVGLGLNVNVSADIAVAIDQPWVDMKSICDGVSRNVLAALSINAILAALRHFENSDFSTYQKRWQHLGAYQGKQVTMIVGERLVEGMLDGISSTGALILQTSEGESLFHGGEVSLRLGSENHDT